jgi:hypothetical protein
MPTAIEEQQAKEFLKRAEIRTMKKDLRSLREVDALKERDKIAKIKTLEEQQAEQEEKLRKKEAERQVVEKEKREKVLSENAVQERLAEKDLKEYATEQERQQIFIFESQRIAFEKKVEEIDNKKDPALKLEKNKILLEKRDWQEKLNKILEQEKKSEDEQNFLLQKDKESNIPAEKKGLEERRWEIEKEIQEIEKKRWQVEKELENIENKITENEKNSQALIIEKNDLNQKILGVDKSLREIYSGVMAKVEEKRRGKLAEQMVARESLAKAKATEKEGVRRQQWTVPTKKMAGPGQISVPVKKMYGGIPVPKKSAPVAKESVQPPINKKSFDFSAEEEARKKFMQNVENWAQKGESPQLKEVPVPKK